MGSYTTIDLSIEYFSLWTIIHVVENNILKKISCYCDNRNSTISKFIGICIDKIIHLKVYCLLWYSCRQCMQRKKRKKEGRKGGKKDIEDKKINLIQEFQYFPDYQYIVFKYFKLYLLCVHTQLRIFNYFTKQGSVIRKSDS